MFARRSLHSRGRWAALLLVAGAALLTHPRAAGAQDPARRWLSYEQTFGGGPGFGGRGRGGGSGTGMPVIVGWVDDEHYLELRADADGARKTFSVAVSDGKATPYTGAVPNPPGAGRRRGGVGANPPAAAPTPSPTVATGAGTRKLDVIPAESRYRQPSPDGRLTAYVVDNNLCVFDSKAGLERRLTTDGSETILNGAPSWVYWEELLDHGAGYWWSPDGTRIAYLRFDDAPVPKFPIYRLGPGVASEPTWQHGSLEFQRYPKSGDPNPPVRLGVVTVADGKTTWMDFDPRADHYLAWPIWTPDSKSLIAQWMPRSQDRLCLYRCDPATGTKTQLHEETRPTWVEFFKDIKFLEGGKTMLLRSDRDGWEHLYVHNLDGSLNRRLTSGSYRVRSIQRIDEKQGWIYFTANPEKPWDTHWMRARLDGSKTEQLTHGEGQHTANVSPGGTYLIDTVNSLTNPGSAALYKSDGTKIRELGSARTREFETTAWGKGECFTIKSDDGQFDLPAYWILPPGFDPNDGTKQYPVIFSIYGGPDFGTVRNAWQRGEAHYWAQRGVITIAVDHRGGGAFGRRGIDAMHRCLGKWEVTDLLTAAKWLRSKPYIARDRIAITGGSYGGYTTLMALFRGGKGLESPDGPGFNFGHAAASVTAWELYDTIYTERYMDTPRENPEGYKAGAVLTYRDRYTGGLRLVHGLVDNNVHTQNTLQVVQWLTNNNKRFELMLYPESSHGIVQGAHLNRERHDFWVRNLLGGKVPEPPTAP